MFNEEHLAILKRGVDAWNTWRNENHTIAPVLNLADLSGANLSGANLSVADLSHAKFIGSKLVGADLRNASLYDSQLSGADLTGANLRDADLRSAKLIGSKLIGSKLINADLSGRGMGNQWLDPEFWLAANLRDADLRDADLSHACLRDASLDNAILIGANLDKANLSGAYLAGANISDADLTMANLSEAWLKNADFTNARLGRTIFAGTNLSQAKGLDSVRHSGPSFISIDTLYESGGDIPEAFLRGCGAPDTFITFARSLVNAAIDFYSCFISYSSKDQAFAERIYADLQNKGVRCWFAPEDLKIGEKLRVGIDESIRLHDKLLLVLSKHSIESEWVEKEVETAMEQERKQKRVLLFPVLLDNSVMKVESGWPADIRRSRNMGDFRKWKDHDAYQKAFSRLLRDLKA